MSRKHILGIFAGIAVLSAMVKFKMAETDTLNYKGIKYYQVYSLNKPDTLFFCSERIPIENKTVEEKLSKEMYHYNYIRRHTNIIVKRVNYWFPKVEKILSQHHIPDDFKYLAVVESGLSNAVSPKGAAGFWQFIPSTARRMGLIVNEEIDERYDPIKATHAACKYLKSAHKQLGDWTNVAAAYNMGISGINRQLKVQRQKKYYDLELNKETARYVYRIIALKEILENQNKYGFTTRKISFPAYTKTSVTTSIDDLNLYAQKQGITLEVLRTFNPWLVGTALSLLEGESITLKIPKDKKVHGVKNENEEEGKILDSLQPTPFLEDSVKEAFKKEEEAEKSELYLNQEASDSIIGS